MSAKTYSEPQIVNFSKYIHPRNPYRKYDFETISKQFLEFKSYLNQAPSKDPEKPAKFFLNWADRDAVRCLMKCCLNKDFGLDLEMPEGCLAPSLALKMNYLLWIEDMSKLNHMEKASGFDIGTGGGIYFIAMANKRFGWTMTGTETNLTDFKIAEKNIDKNNLAQKVRVIHNKDKKVIFPSDMFSSSSSSLDQEQKSVMTFSVCNPPFYEVTEQRREWKKFGSEKNPGREHEMAISGGEVDFIGKMIDQSHNCKDRVDLFTTLVGQKKSLGKLLDKLSKSKDVKKWVLNEFCQGKTMRWCIAWTFKDWLKLKASAPISEARHTKKIFTPVRFEIDKICSKAEFHLNDVLTWITSLIATLSIDIVNQEINDDEINVSFRSLKSNWRGQRAKKRQAKLKFCSQSDDETEPNAKRARLESEPVGSPADSNLPAEPVVTGTIRVHSNPESGKLVLDMTYESGTMGKCAIVELSQFFKNRFNAENVLTDK